MSRLIRSFLGRFWQNKRTAPRRPFHRSALSLECLEERLAPSGVVANYSIVQNWGSGFQATLGLVNQQAVNVPNSKPSVSIANTSVTEPTTGTTNADFNVTLSAKSTKPVTVYYSTANGTAHAGIDYQAKNSSVTFAAGQTQKTIAIKVLADAAADGNETFTVNLTSVKGATLGRAQATGTIHDAVPPTLTAANDTASTTTGVATTINVLANDVDTSGTALTVKSVTQGQHGSVVVNANETVTYTPAAGFSGADSFTYTVADGVGLTAHATVSVTVSNPTVSNWPAHVFAPYVDMTLYPTPNLVSFAQTEGIKFFSLAFIVADGTTPSWGGYSAYDVNGGAFDQQMRTQISGLRALGGDVMASFGGEAGQELALVITNVSQLAAAYQSVINAYQLTHVDFDIEGAAVADHASIDRRSQALAQLQQQAAAAGKTLDISFTLPVLPTGLTPDGLYVVQSALKYGLKISVVNIMTMDYGDGAAPNPQGQMGAYAIQAATSLHGQLQTAYGAALTSAQAWQMIGVTPMIGVNDVTDERSSNRPTPSNCSPSHSKTASASFRCGHSAATSKTRPASSVIRPRPPAASCKHRLNSAESSSSSRVETTATPPPSVTRRQGRGGKGLKAE